MAFILSRNARLYVSTEDIAGGIDWDASTMTNANTYRIEVLDGFNFPSNTTVQDITVSEAGATPIRGQQSFTTSIDPVEWSFSSYVRPYADTTVKAPEQIMWASMADPVYTDSLVLGNAGTYGPTTGSDITFANSNVNQLQKLFLYFDIGGVWYKISNAVVDTAEFDFGIDQIAMIAWSGQADSAAEIVAPTTFTAGTGYLDLPTGPAASFLQNKLTTVDVMDNGTVRATDTDGDVATGTTFTSASVGDFAAAGAIAGDFVYIVGDGYYAIANVATTTITLAQAATTAGTLTFTIFKGFTLALTGGNLSVANNITFLTPESLGVINTPIDHFAGTRGVSGAMTAYLKTGGANDTGDLYDQIATDTSTITQDFRLVFHVGGSRTVDTQIEFVIEHAHLVVPTINVEDVLALNIDYTALPHNGTVYDLEATNELAITYRHA